MAKFLIYCYYCDEEYETSHKKMKCPHCGSRDVEIFNQQSSKQKKNIDRITRRDF